MKGNVQFSVRNLTRHTFLGGSIDLANTSAARRTGLLKRKGLDEGEGLWIAPCEAIHTFFMKFAIDVIYLDREQRVRKAVKNLVPWRISACLVAHSVLELAPGTIERTGTQRGDQLQLQEIPAER